MKYKRCGNVNLYCWLGQRRVLYNGLSKKEEQKNAWREYKKLRKRKGYSQETLAQQLNAVRQTISKWEKGISLPDAEMLTKNAVLFDVTVEALLGAEAEEKPYAVSMNEIAAQLAVLNEQMANQSRRRKRIRAVLIGLSAIAISFFLGFLGLRNYADTPTGGRITSELSCALNGQEYSYTVTYDEQCRIISAGGDAFAAGHVQDRTLR